jgi:ketosteroid isomerase-like protein
VPPGDNYLFWTAHRGHPAPRFEWRKRYWTFLLKLHRDRPAPDVEQVVADGDAVVLSLHSVGRGNASGVPVDVRWAAAFRVIDGKISRVDVHGDWAKALGAVGLEG